MDFLLHAWRYSQKKKKSGLKKEMQNKGHNKGGDELVSIDIDIQEE